MSPSVPRRPLVLLLTLAVLTLWALLAQPSSAVELAGSGTVEVISTQCATIQCPTVADGGGLLVSFDGGSTNSYRPGERVRVLATETAVLGTSGVASGIAVSTAPEAITFGSANGLGLQPWTGGDGGVSIFCRSTSGVAGTANVCPIRRGTGGQ